MPSSKPSGSTTTTTKSDPWEGQQPYLKQAFSEAERLYGGGIKYGTPQQYDQAGYDRALAAYNASAPNVTVMGKRQTGKQVTGYTLSDGRVVDASGRTLNVGDVYEIGKPTGNAPTLDQYAIPGSATPDGVSNNRLAPEYYPGQMIATDSPETQTALQARTSRALYGSPLTAAAQGELTKTLGGQYLNSNPYLDAMYNQAARNTVNKYNEIVNPGIDSAFTSAGRFGSGAYAQARNQADRTAASELGDLAANIYGTNYANERANQIKGMLYAPELANQDYYDINQLSSVGDYKTNLAQQQIEADKAKYDYNAQRDLIALQNYQNLIQGNYGGTQTQSNPYFRNSVGSTIGTVAQGVGAIGSLASLFSDIRMKENIKYAGTENGHNIYEFNYIGQPERYTGVMAQEVMKTRPDAVIHTPEGLKVNYDAIGVQMRRI